MKGELVEKLLSVKDDATRFVLEFLGAEPTMQQRMGLEAISREEAKVSIRSGHSTGKTSLLSWVILWYLLTRHEVKIPCTAPSQPQLRNVLWPEVAKWAARLQPPELRGLIMQSMDKIWLVGAHNTNFAVARTARPENPEALQGFHGPHLMFIVDEASGVDDKVFEVARSALSSRGARVIMCSNPTRSTGYFYDTHHGAREYWTTLHFSCLDSPLVNMRFVEEIEVEYGEDSDFYRVRILGEFPKSEPDQLIPLEVVQRAIDREVEEAGQVVWGLDPAWRGDCETALAVRRGDEILEVDGIRGYDTMAVVGWVRQKYDAQPDDRKPSRIFVDIIGYGAGVYDRLKELGYPVVAINVGLRVGGRYSTVRDQLWYVYRDWLMNRGKIPDDPRLVAQTVAMRALPPNSMGEARVISKRKMSLTGTAEKFASPDRADAVCLTMAASQEYMSSRRSNFWAQFRRFKPMSPWAA